MSGFEVQVNIEQALKKLVDFEPVTILTASTIVTGEARKLPNLIGLGVAMKTSGKKNVARVIDVTLHADPKKEGAVLGRVKLFAGGDVTGYVGLLVMLEPLQTELGFVPAFSMPEGSEAPPTRKRKRKKKGEV